MGRDRCPDVEVSEVGLFSKREESVPLRDRFAQQVLVMDGPIRDALLTQGLPKNESPELVSADRPEIVADTHRTFVDAGAEIVRTNTFAASAPALAAYGLEERMREINTAAVKAARIAGAQHVFGVVGPTGLAIAPYGDIPFDEVHRVFRDQIEAMADAGIDGVLVENMMDLQEARAAILAARETTDVPVVCTFSFGADGRTVGSRTDPLTAAVVVAGMGVTHIGTGCGVDAAHMAQALELMGRASALPLICEVDAGARQDAAVEQMPSYVAAGAGIVGTCCGSSPAVTRAVADRVVGQVPPTKRRARATLLAARSSTVAIHPEAGVVVIGERINAGNNSELAEHVRAGNTAAIVDEAQKQVDAGAHVLDINLAMEGVDEAKVLTEAIQAIQARVDVPVSINTSSPRSLEKALRVCCGKALVNFVSAKEGSIARVLPVAKKYGAAVIGLLLDDAGLPGTVFDRVDMAKFMIDECGKAGIQPNDLVVDCVVMSAAESQEQVKEALEAVRQISKKMDLNTTVRVASVSHALPNRPALNRAFLAMGLMAGLDSAIVDPAELGIRETFDAANVLLGRDRGAALFKQRYVE